MDTSFLLMMITLVKEGKVKDGWVRDKEGALHRFLPWDSETKVWIPPLPLASCTSCGINILFSCAIEFLFLSLVLFVQLLLCSRQSSFFDLSKESTGFFPDFQWTCEQESRVSSGQQLPWGLTTKSKLVIRGWVMSFSSFKAIFMSILSKKRAGYEIFWSTRIIFSWVILFFSKLTPFKVNDWSPASFFLLKKAIMINVCSGIRSRCELNIFFVQVHASS